MNLHGVFHRLSCQLFACNWPPTKLIGRVSLLSLLHSSFRELKSAKVHRIIKEQIWFHFFCSSSASLFCQEVLKMSKDKKLQFLKAHKDCFALQLFGFRKSQFREVNELSRNF